MDLDLQYLVFDHAGTHGLIASDKDYANVQKMASLISATLNGMGEFEDYGRNRISDRHLVLE